MIHINVPHLWLEQNAKRKMGLESVVIKTILVPLVGAEVDTQTLDAAYQFARSCGAHLDCLHVRPDAAANALPMTAYLAGLTFWTPEMAKSFESAARDSAASARNAFEIFSAKTRIVRSDQPLLSPGVSASYREVEGDCIRQIVLEARVHELVIIARSQKHFGLSEYSLGEILVGSGRPLILAGDEMPMTCAQHIAIAWKSTAEAARAIAAAMPLLVRAERIVVLSMQEEGQSYEQVTALARKLEDELAWHGIDPHVRCLMQSSSPVDTLLDEAHDLGADLFVMGGYGHGRARELIFGGFTRGVLRQAPLPVFLVH